jgi:putative nucleotidyltransferase with HDIG domain
MTHRAESRPPSTNGATLSGLELRVPPMPRTLTEALSMMENSDRLDMAVVTEMVQRDPVVVARLLNIVNSAYYGLRHQITSIERAIVMLGPIAVAGIIVGMQMLKLRELVDGPAGACFNRLIRHSVATAVIARHLAERSSNDRRVRQARMGPAFTAGLLHDFGKIILVYNFPKKAVALYDGDSLAGQIDNAGSIESEHLVFGYDHTEAGEYVARKLNFPELLVDIVRHHHDGELTSSRPEAAPMLNAVAIANLAASAMGYGFARSTTREDLLENDDLDRLVSENAYYVSREHLLNDIFSLQAELDEYVAVMTTSPSDATRVVRRSQATPRPWTHPRPY